MGCWRLRHYFAHWLPATGLYSYPNTNAHADSYADRHRDSNINPYPYFHTYTDCNSYAHAYQYAYPNLYTNAYRDRNTDTNPNADTRCYSLGPVRNGVGDGRPRMTEQPAAPPGLGLHRFCP